jgi:hypothetical protein
MGEGGWDGCQKKIDAKPIRRYPEASFAGVLRAVS